jgi:hypothetical protein
MDLREIGWDGMDWIALAQDGNFRMQLLLVISGNTFEQFQSLHSFQTVL